jgi:hypothetical protein
MAGSCGHGNEPSGIEIQCTVGQSSWLGIF